MLSIYYGDMPEAIYDPVKFFKNTYSDEWITDELSVQIILDIDKSRVLGARVIDSPVLGGISPRELSGGTKTLIAINQRPDRIFNASACGDNCAKWLLKIGESKDITINLRHLMRFEEKPFEIRVVNTGTVVHDPGELFEIAAHIVR